MGLLDMFKKKENNVENRKKSMPEKRDNYTINENIEGKFQLDYTEAEPKFGQFYDTTRLVVDKINNDVSKCRVSWYGHDDAIIINPETGEEVGRLTNYSEILTKIDYDLLQRDPNYVRTLMVTLLKRNRVEEYLARGLQENPELPCGEYVGHVQLKDGKYQKVFDEELGRQSHYSERMRQIRQFYRDTEIREKNLKLRELEEKKAYLNAEINRLKGLEDR